MGKTPVSLGSGNGVSNAGSGACPGVNSGNSFDPASGDGAYGFAPLITQTVVAGFLFVRHTGVGVDISLPGQSVLPVNQRQFIVSSFRHPLLEVVSANRKITLIAADLDLASILDGFAFRIDSQHHGRFAATMTNGFDLGQAIGPGKQLLAAFE